MSYPRRRVSIFGFGHSGLIWHSDFVIWNFQKTLFYLCALCELCGNFFKFLPLTLKTPFQPNTHRFFEKISKTIKKWIFWQLLRSRALGEAAFWPFLRFLLFTYNLLSEKALRVKTPKVSPILSVRCCVNGQRFQYRKCTLRFWPPKHAKKTSQKTPLKCK